ncbi:MAG: alpha/beta hydrolase [Candidatus Peregrinibacteria bacterium]|nr:alpha/beta hydrolase [Candidatus Peregrinibacteria bacterium]
MKPVLVCLHGWGGSKESFTELRAALQGKEIDILTPDLPGFGSTPEPKEPWTVDDYAQWVERWLQNQKPETKNQQPVLLLGHSHGGRIAIKIALRGNVPVSHLFLCASAGIKHPRHVKRVIGLTLAKTGKFFLAIPGLRALAPLGRKLLYKLVRVHDYERASPVMRETLIRVTSEDFRKYLREIAIPTDIFWGEDDRMTPLSDGQYMHSQIRGSTFHTYPSVRHAVHRARAREIAEVISSKPLQY